MTFCMNQLIEFANMQLAYRHDERPGESYETLEKIKRGLMVRLKESFKGGFKGGLKGW